MSDVREAHRWCEDFLRLTPSERKVVARQVLEELLAFSEKGEGDSDTRAGKKLVSELRDASLYELVGVSPNVQYFKVEGEKEDLSAWWVHPFSVPTLLFKHKRLPFLVQVNPYLRYNENFTQDPSFQRWQKIHLGELGHVERDATGISG
jgi:hypothetical protein